MPHVLKDTRVRVTRALPAAASTTVNSTSIDLGHNTSGDFVVHGEFLLSAPAVNTTMAPDTRTFTYSIITSALSDMSSPTVVQSSVITQTGAGGAGAAATTYRFALPTTVARFVGVRVVSGASTGDASSVSATLEFLG
jgi:hypothetical protein